MDNPGEDVTAAERGCPACGHDLANHYEDDAVRWCANCDGPCEPQRGDGGGSESQVAPGRLADEERSAPPPPADEYDAAWREAWAVHRVADYVDVPMGQVVQAIRAAIDGFTPLPQSLELPTLGNLARSATEREATEPRDIEAPRHPGSSGASVSGMGETT